MCLFSGSKIDVCHTEPFGPQEILFGLLYYLLYEDKQIQSELCYNCIQSHMKLHRLAQPFFRDYEKFDSVFEENLLYISDSKTLYFWYSFFQTNISTMFAEVMTYFTIFPSLNSFITSKTLLQDLSKYFKYFSFLCGFRKANILLL